MHITRDLLRLVAGGELPPRMLARVGLEHLTALCPCCEREVRAWKAERPGGNPLDPAFVVPLLATAAPKLEREEERAERDFQELLALSNEVRLKRVSRSRTRFRGPALIRRMLGLYRELLREDIGAAYQTAALALSIANRSTQSFDLHVLAAAAMGNACRAQGDLLTAERHFDYVRYLLHSQDVTDLAIMAEVDDLEGSLRKDQRRFDQAENLLERAYALYKLIGLEGKCTKVKVILADVHFYRGDLAQAISTLSSALRKIHPESEIVDYLCARHNLAWYLMSGDRFEEATEICEEDSDLFRRYGHPVGLIRHRWLEGKIAAGIGQSGKAEAALLSAREGFIERAMGFDAGIVSMDLAALYLRSGRINEVRALAEQIIPIFQAQDIHREALAALVMFQEAARREVVTLAFVERLALYLREAEADHELRFRSGEGERIR